jgi:membrane fusion protein, multidrug efflux system
MKKAYVWIGVIILLIIILVFAIRSGKAKGKGNSVPQKEKQQIKVDGYIVKPTLLVNEISVSGSLLAFEQVELKNEVAGRVTDINLPEGKPVKKGTLLVKFYDEDLQATLRKLESQLEVQNKIYDRQSELIKVNGISENDYDQTRLAVNTLKSDIDEQKALIRKTEVIAPFDGVIGLRNISVGAVVSSSTLLATIRTEDNLKLDFYVPEKYSALISQGMKVKFTLSNKDIQYDATVIATEEGIDAATLNLKVRAVVDSRSQKLLPGAFTDVELRLGENPDALMIPTGAVIPEEQNKSVIIAKKGKAHFVPVKTGARQSSSIEITEGLHEGDTVITTGILFLKEGSGLSYSSVIDSL